MKYLATLIMLTLVTAPAAALALKIGNCGDKPHTVTVDYFGESEAYTLTPGAWQRISAKARSLTLGEQRVTVTHRTNRYCIWDGKISLQSRERHMRGR